MENRLLLNIIEDKYRRFQKNYSITFTDFFDMMQQSSADKFVKNHAKEGVFWYGGYEGADRKKIIFVPDYMDVNGEKDLQEHENKNGERKETTKYKKGME